MFRMFCRHNRTLGVLLRVYKIFEDLDLFINSTCKAFSLID